MSSTNHQHSSFLKKTDEKHCNAITINLIRGVFTFPSFHFFSLAILSPFLSPQIQLWSLGSTLSSPSRQSPSSKYTDYVSGAPVRSVSVEQSLQANMVVSEYEQLHITLKFRRK